MRPAQQLQNVMGQRRVHGWIGELPPSMRESVAHMRGEVAVAVRGQEQFRKAYDSESEHL